MSISRSSLVLAIARIFEGIGYGLLFLSIVSLASQFPNREGEVLGGLFAAIFSGLAIGQGVAGLLWRFLQDISDLSSTQTIQFVAGLAFLITAVSLVIFRPSLDPNIESIQQKWKWQHFHAGRWIRTLLGFPSIAFY